MEYYVILTPAQTATAVAFIEAFGLRANIFWPTVSRGMADDFGIDDPNNAVDDLLSALQS